MLLRNADLDFLQRCGIAVTNKPQGPTVPRTIYDETAEMAVFYEAQAFHRGREARNWRAVAVVQSLVLILLGVWVVWLITARKQHPSSSAERPPSTLSSGQVAPQRFHFRRAAR